MLPHIFPNQSHNLNVLIFFFKKKLCGKSKIPKHNLKKNEKLNFHTSDKYNREQIKIIFEDFVAKKAFRLISFFSRAIEIQENLDVSGYRCIVKCSSVARGSAGSSTYEQQPVEKKISHSPKGCASVCYKMAGE